MINNKEIKELVDKNHSSISISRQAEILGISRSSVYYQPIINQHELQLLNFVDQIFTDYPFYGSRRIKNELKDRFDVIVCRDYVRKLMRLLGLEAIYPKSKKNTSQPDNQHRKYPYLLKNLPIIRPNQVWGTDITYIRLNNGWCYLVAIIDWYSRYVISWQLSNHMETSFCADTLKSALKIAIPEIHNSDQGVQYTSNDYIDILTESEIIISMDGRGRCMDNIFTERLWRSVKYENVYIKSYDTIPEAREGLDDYFKFYNHKRRHQSLEYQTPAQIYFNKI